MSDQIQPATDAQLEEMRRQYQRYEASRSLDLVASNRSDLSWEQVAALLARVEEERKKVADAEQAALQGYCAYCGHITKFATADEKLSEAGRAKMIAHIFECPNRPEKVLGERLGAAEATLAKVRGRCEEWPDDVMAREILRLLEEGPAVGLECPFCGVSDFDLPGLKYHLSRYCAAYEVTEVICPPWRKPLEEGPQS